MRSVLRRAARSAVLALTALLGTVLPAPLSAETIEDKAQLCAACHGENGIPQQKTTPVIWGQHQGYLYLDLRDYKSGARKNHTMSPLAQTPERHHPLALPLYLSQQRPPPPQPPHGPPDLPAPPTPVSPSLACTASPPRHY